MKASIDIDDDLIEYLSNMLVELPMEELTKKCSESPVWESMSPFLESSGLEEDEIVRVCEGVNDLAISRVAVSKSSGGTSIVRGSSSLGSESGAPSKLKGIVSMSSDLRFAEAESEANRYMWGTTSANCNTQKDAHSSVVSSKDRRKARQDLERARTEYEAKMNQMNDEEHSNQGKAAVSTMVLPDYQSGRNEKDIQVRSVSLALDNGRAILENAELKFAYRRRYGLVGKNGIGKTTLLKAVAAMEIPGFPRHHRVLHVRQEMSAAGGDITVLQAVLQADVERNALLQEEQQLLQKLDAHGTQPDTNNNDNINAKREQLKDKLKNDANDNAFKEQLKRLDEVYARLAVIGGDGAESRAAVILSGLQFTTDMQQGPTSALSGGWRMRVSLAAALFIEPDLLLLDEPTNHLDLEAVLWLESYLVQYKHTMVVVSHDRGFLNEVCSDIIQFKDLTLTYYKGNYDTYVKTSDEMTKNAMRVYHAYQDKRAHIMEFIDKFRCNAKRATLVQSRIKTVEKMDAEAPPAVEIEPVWRFSIPNPPPLSRPIIAIDDVYFDYNTATNPKTNYLLQKVNFGVDLDSRIGILGANGAGKSTLLNLIMDKLTPLRGTVSRNSHLRIGHFTQHSAEKFNLQLSSIENLLQIFDNEGATDQDIRSFLGRFQIQGSDALKPMLMLSGGQKSRVAFATLAYCKPHVIIMDEPTNHLDMESIDALVEAVKDFKGGLIVVSHDQFFITNTCTELWVVGQGEATQFRGGFDEYKKYTLEKTAKRVAESVKSLSAINN